ncbi:MAG: relaxase MobL [Bacilli bacterium]
MSTPNVVLRLRYYKPEDAYLDVTNESNAKKVNARNYYSSNTSDGSDYMNYIDDGIKKGNGFDYIDYMGNPEKSSGVFYKNGLMSKEKMKEVRNLLRKTKSVIWDMVISFEEEFGDKYIRSYEDAMEIVKHNLPKILKDNGLQDDNVIWFAGLHRNTENKHIHISFFEIEPIHKRANKKGEFYHIGEFKRYSLDNLKVAIEEYMTDNKFFFESHRRSLISESDDFLSSLDNRDKDQKVILKKLGELYHLLPKGKVGYGHESIEHLRPLIGEIEALILNNNPTLKKQYFELKKQLKERDLNITRICESQKIKPDRYLLAEKYMNDFHRRIGNKIIMYAKKYELDSNWEGLNYERQSKVRKNIKRNRTLLFKSTATLNRMVAQEAERVFTDFRKRLKEAEYQRLVEEGVIEAE